MSKDDFRSLSVEEQVELLEPGDPSSIPQEVWDAWKQDEMYADYMEDAQRIEQERELIASLAEDPELRAEVSERVAEIENRSGQQVSLKYRSKQKRQVLLALMEKPNRTYREVCEWLDYHWEDELPYGKPFVKAYQGDERPHVESLISKVRADLRRSRRRSF